MLVRLVVCGRKCARGLSPLLLGGPLTCLQDVEHSKEVHDMHAAAEVFDPETEQVYKYLQVFSACAVSFAHGANDVANAVGPFAAIW